MNKPDFRNLIIKASSEALRFGEQYVSQELPQTFKYQVWLNQSYEASSSTEFAVYPADDGKAVLCNDPNEVVELLCREGKIPVWIDIALHKRGAGYTILGLTCAGRYTDDKKAFYYHRNGTGPFGIKSPHFLLVGLRVKPLICQRPNLALQGTLSPQLRCSKTAPEGGRYVLLV